MTPRGISHLSTAVALLALGLTCAPAAFAEDQPSERHLANLKRVEELLKQRQEKTAPHEFVRRGVLADRQKRSVRVDAEATGLKEKEIAEFAIITEHSSHDYEGLVSSFAKPSDIVAAVEFIGMPRGRPLTATKMARWPKGERVRVSVELPDGTRRPIEEFIIDLQMDGRTLPVEGFIFAGAAWEERDGKQHCLTDDMGPGSILSMYNEPTTVFDVPRLAEQGEVYERYLANPAALLEKEQMVTLWITPEPRPAEHPKRVVDLTLSIASPTGAPEIAATQFRLAEAGQSADTAPAQTLLEVLKSCRSYLPERDPYVTLDWNDSVSLQAAVDLCAVLQTLDNAAGIRIEPPKAGQLYYRAFVPRADWRDRAMRMTQPCELRFTKAADGKVATTLVRIEENWDNNPENLRPDLKVHETAVASLEEFPEALAAQKVEWPVLLVFAPGDLSLEAIMPYLRSVQTTHPNIYVFLE